MITFRHDFAIHEGGTKFYAVLSVKKGYRQFCVTHWGSYHSGASIWPAAFGQSDVKVGEGSTLHNGAIKRKSSRGYRFGTKTHESMSESEVLEYLRNKLKPAQMRLLEEFLDGRVRDDEDESDEALTDEELAAIPVASVSPLEVPIVKPVEVKETSDTPFWGSW